MQYLFSDPNSKHLLDTIYSYSIPNSKRICVDAGDCINWCMIDKGNFQIYPNIMQGYQDRYKLTLQYNFVDIACHELQNRRIKGNKIEFVRPHVSGEYYNQLYLDKWTEIFKRNNNIRFVTYTKSFKRLNWRKAKRLDNVAMIESEGGKHPVRKRNAHARIFRTVHDIPINYVNCNESDSLAWETAKNGNGNIALLLK